MEACHEHIKLHLNTYKQKIVQKIDKNFEEEATQALVDTPIFALRVFEAVKCHKTLLKTPNFKDTTFKAKAKELFPHSTYFSSA